MDREQEKQGYLGNLHDKTLAQLQELLQRQEKLLAKQRFLDSLPDKGEKVQKFAGILREVISLKEKHENSMTFSTQVFQTLPKTQREDLSSGLESNQQVSQRGMHADFVSLRDTVSQKKLIDDDLHTQDEEKAISKCDGICHDVTAVLSEHLQSLTVGSREDRMISDSQDGENSAHSERKFQNSYEKVIRKEHIKDKEEPFKPHRTLKIVSVKELPEKFKPKSNVPDVKKHRDSSSSLMPVGVAQTFCGQETWSSTHKHREESAIHLPAHKYEKAKMISVEDSIEIQRRQKEETERLQALHAAERLAERLHIKMEDYNTWVPDMDYRGGNPAHEEEAEAEDSDDSDESPM